MVVTSPENEKPPARKMRGWGLLLVVKAKLTKTAVAAITYTLLGGI